MGGAVRQGQDQLVAKCRELRRIWQGPGQHSHQLKTAMLELFELLPEDGPSLSVHVSDSIAVRSKVGG